MIHLNGGAGNGTITGGVGAGIQWSLIYLIVHVHWR